MHTNLVVSDEQFVRTDNVRLSSLIKAVENARGYSFEGQISSKNACSGKLAINKEDCTGCGLCAVNCPFESLTFETTNNRLLFHYDLCTGCGICVDICPQKCLQLERVLEFSKLGKEPELLFQDDTVYCHICRTPITSKSMMREVKSKLQESGCTIDNLELCSNCKLLHRNNCPDSRTVKQSVNRNKHDINTIVGTIV
jgi:Pyruvate/2-oxoacid:ferredoxin oxidoreductase delta subunit